MIKVKQKGCGSGFLNAVESGYISRSRFQNMVGSGFGLQNMVGSVSGFQNIVESESDFQNLVKSGFGANIKVG